MFNCLSWNVNSIRKRKRRARVQQCIKLWKPDFLILQETRLESCNDRIVEQIWGGGNCGWAAPWDFQEGFSSYGTKILLRWRIL